MTSDEPDFWDNEYLIREIVSKYGDKWSLLVLFVIDRAAIVRFNELGRMISDIPTRVLSGRLKTLVNDGLIERKIYTQVPPKVEYTLTEAGKSLIPIILQLTEWAKINMKR